MTLEDSNSDHSMENMHTLDNTSDMESDAESNASGEDTSEMLVEDTHRSSTDKSKNIYRPPTTNEIQELNQAGELFKSNLFKMQVCFIVVVSVVVTMVHFTLWKSHLLHR